MLPTLYTSHVRTISHTQEGLLRQRNQLDAYVAWHRQQGLAPSLDEMMEMPSNNERWSQPGATGNQKGAPKVTVILNLFMREVSEDAGREGELRGWDKMGEGGRGAPGWGGGTSKAGGRRRGERETRDIVMPILSYSYNRRHGTHGLHL